MKEKFQIITDKIKVIEETTASVCECWGFKVMLNQTKRSDSSDHSSLSVTRKWGDETQAYWIELLTSEELQACKKWGLLTLLEGRASYHFSEKDDIQNLRKMSDQIKKRKKTNEEIFDSITKGEGDLFPIFFCSWDHSFFVPSEQKTYVIYHANYIEFRLDNQNYDLEKCLEHLKKLKDPNIFLVEEILSIPYYNRERGRTHYIAFNYCEEYTSYIEDRHSQYTRIKQKIGIEQFKRQRE